MFYKGICLLLSRSTVFLSLVKKIPLWTNEKILKQQSIVKVFSTSDLVEFWKTA